MMERSSRQRKASMKLRVFLESEDSEGEDWDVPIYSW